MYTHPIRLKHGDAHGVTEFHHQRFRKDERNCPEIRGLGTHFCEMQISQENLKRFRNKLPWQNLQFPGNFPKTHGKSHGFVPFKAAATGATGPREGSQLPVHIPTTFLPLSEESEESGLFGSEGGVPWLQLVAWVSMGQKDGN